MRRGPRLALAGAELGPRDFERFDSAAVCPQLHRGAPPALVVMKHLMMSLHFSGVSLSQKRLSVSVVAL